MYTLRLDKKNTTLALSSFVLWEIIAGAAPTAEKSKMKQKY